MLYKASEFWQIIVGFLFNGLAIGLSESMIYTFLGESRYFDVKRGGNKYVSFERNEFILGLWNSFRFDFLWLYFFHFLSKKVH